MTLMLAPGESLHDVSAGGTVSTSSFVAPVNAQKSVAEPETVKLGGPEGYEHNWVCVRPPCGGKLGKVRAADLSVTRDGKVVHRPTGYVIGSVKKTGSGFSASHHLTGKTIEHEKRGGALTALARHHNKQVKDDDMDLIPKDEDPKITETLSHLNSANDDAHVYSDKEAHALADRLDALKEELKEEQKKDSRTDIAIEIGTVAAAVGLSFFTGGASLISLLPLFHEHLPEVGKIALKAGVHAKKFGAAKVVASAVSRARTALGTVTSRFRKAPQLALAAKADKSISSAAIAQVAAIMTPELVNGGMDDESANELAIALTNHAALALRAGKKPWDNDFITADGNAEGDDVDSVTKSAETAEASTVHHPLGTHGLWGSKNDQLPAYIQNVAHALIRSGHDESSAISIAVGSVKRWAAGRGNVTPEVQAAAGKALAEWEKLKAEHSKSKG